jgi:hypothetical protein
MRKERLLLAYASDRNTKKYLNREDNLRVSAVAILSTCNTSSHNVACIMCGYWDNFTIGAEGGGNLAVCLHDNSSALWVSKELGQNKKENSSVGKKN